MVSSLSVIRVPDSFLVLFKAELSTSAHPSVAPLIAESWNGPNHTQHLSRRMNALNERHMQLDNILLEVIALEMIVYWTQQDMGVSRDTALNIVSDSDIIEYGRLAVDPGQFEAAQSPVIVRRSSTLKRDR
jgi:hypothetical protein